MDTFLTIVFTSPDSVANEAIRIAALLDEGVDYVHIRKPEWSLREVKNLIEDIPYRLRKRLRLHGHYELLNEMNLAGVHLNSRNPVAPYNANSISASCHSIDDVLKSSDYEYVTLSPIFDSISKENYNSKFNLDGIESQIRGRRVVALGGVTPEMLFLLKEKGFYGAALLGYIWGGDFDESRRTLSEAISRIKTKN